MLYSLPFICLVPSLLFRNDKKVSILFYKLVVCFLIIFCALKDPFLYPDNDNYFYFFRGDVNEFEENFGLGYTMLNHISRIFSPSFYFFMMMIAVIVITSYAIIIKRYSPYIWASLFIFILINYFPSFFLLRQYLAIAVFLYSIKYLINREAFKYGLCVLIAMSFHLSAIIVAPLYYLYGLKNTKKNMLLLAIGSIAVILFFMAISSLIGMFSAYYAKYLDWDNDSPAWQRALMKLYFLGVYLIATSRSYYKEGINRIIFYCCLFGAVISIAAINLYAAHRLLAYFTIAEFIGIPVIINEVSLKSRKRIPIVYYLLFVYIIVLIVSFVSFVEGGNINNDYQFFWKASDYQQVGEQL